MPIKLLLADDHQLFRSGLMSLLDGESSVQIVCEARDGFEVIDCYHKFSPDVLLVDIHMPEKSGLEAVKELTSVASIKALFLSMYEGEEYVYNCFRAGGCGLISKNISRYQLLNAIQLVHAGKQFFTFKNEPVNLQVIIKKYDLLFKKNKFKKSYDYTPREEEILAYVGMGYKSQIISEMIGVSRRTVEKHRSNLMQKLNISTLPEFIRYAVQFALERKEN